MQHQFTSLLVFLTSILPATAQFHTISRDIPPVITDHYTEETYNSAAADTCGTIVIELADTLQTASFCDALTPEQRRQLYLQLAYFDNEIDERYIALFELQIARQAATLKRQSALSGHFDFEEGCSSGVAGHYNPSEEITIESVLAEILKNNIAHPRIVLAQAILETGWFKSAVCRNYHNLFGLTNPRTKDYYRFNTWQESVAAYYSKVQYRYKGGNYLTWLRKIGYAEDPDYTAKLRILLDGPLMKYCQ